MLKAKEASERQRDNAVAVKERVIANRDEKLRVLKIEAQEQAALQAAQAELHSDALAALETVNAERLMTIKRMAGKLGGRPRAPRTEEELGELPRSTAGHCSKRMTENVIGAIGIVGTDSEISISSLMNALYTAGYLDGVWESERDDLGVEDGDGHGLARRPLALLEREPLEGCSRHDPLLVRHDGPAPVHVFAPPSWQAVGGAHLAY